MILSDGEIISLMGAKELVITPLGQNSIQPASIDIRLGNTFCVADAVTSGIVRFDDAVKYRRITSERYVLLPGQFVLATTVEYIKLPNYLTAFVEGRSSIGRLGLFVQNAGWVDPGFEGEITLEMYNASPFAIELVAGKRVGQLVFARTGKPAQIPYSGKYQGQRGATGSRIFMDVPECEIQEEDESNA